MRPYRKQVMPARVATILATVGLLAVLVSSCGDDDGTADAPVVPSEFAAPTEAPGDAAEGGLLKVMASADVFMDPGAAYDQFSYMVTNATQRTLVGWEPDDTDDPTPDFATGEPEISEDNRTLTYTVRDDVSYSPPVDRAATAADVEYALERALLPGVANGYASIYFVDVAGYDAAAKQAEQDPTGGAPDLEGITAVDEQTLEIELERPTASLVAQALSLPISAPVPEDYARPFDAENPSTYGQHVTFTGPYMVENDNTGELTGYTPGKEIKLVRNPNWNADSDSRPAYLDAIEIQEGFTETASAARKILDGEASVNGDFSPPPTVLKRAATGSAADQLALAPSGGNRYVALNTQEPPFDDIDVRKAVLANSNRTELRNTIGGELVGTVATHFLTPDVAGFEEAGGLEGDAANDFVADPGGDPELAASYMRDAGFESGKCQGADCRITMVGVNTSPQKDTAEVVRGQLEELGFDVDLRLVSEDVMYGKFCVVPTQQPDVCPNVGWQKDFTDPQSLLDVPFNGASINPENNPNFPQLDVEAINRAIDEATVVNGAEERNQAWGKIDTQITAQAPAIPWAWDNQANIRSADVAGVVNGFTAKWDLSHTSLEQQ